jgi:phosphonate transport system substrate-binding protein
MFFQGRTIMKALTLAGRRARQAECRRATSRRLAATFAGAAFAFSAVLGIPAAQAEIELTFGAYTSEKPSAVVRQLRPTLDEIAKRTTAILGERTEIRLKIVSTYMEGIAKIADGGFDFTRLGPASYVTAKQQNAGVGVLAIENKKGRKENTGVICVRTDSDITSVKQLKGRSVAFGNKRSTLGRYFAQQLLMRHGVSAQELSRYEYLGRHDKVGRAVGSGKFEAGALSQSTFKKLTKKGVPIRAIATYNSVTKAWVARAGMDPRIKRALSQALLSIEDRSALKALRFDGFFKGADSDFELTRKAMRDNPAFFAGSS